jgi:hypothetical protein
MNIMATATTLPLTAACGEPIGLFHSSSEDIPPAAESVPAAKNLVLPVRAGCLGPSCESLNREARQPHPCPSSLEGDALHDGHRDSFRRPGCAGAVPSWHRRGHRRNSGHGKRCSFRSLDDTGRRRHGVGRTQLHNRRPRHHWGGRCQGFWETSPWTKTTVSEPDTVWFRDMPDASTVVVGFPRRTVFQKGRRVLADSELDDDPFCDHPTLPRGDPILSRCGPLTEVNRSCVAAYLCAVFARGIGQCVLYR